MFDLLVGHVPWPLLALAFLLCLAISALGFRRVDWFISLGYGYSIAAEAVLLALVYQPRDPLLIAALLLLAAYGLRLGIFLTLRERQSSFARELEASRQRSAHVQGRLKFAIWVGVSALYVAMASPAAIGLEAVHSGRPVPTLWLGVVIMAAGLALETIADQQKSTFKAREPSRFVRTGLFAIVRSPNYLGEMTFWLGLFLAAIDAYSSLAAWLVAGVGLVCIELIMLGSARRLEIKQAERYDGDPAYEDYVRRVPIIFPLLPLYSLRKLKVYLG